MNWEEQNFQGTLSSQHSSTISRFWKDFSLAAVTTFPSVEGSTLLLQCYSYQLDFKVHQDSPFHSPTSIP